MPRRARNLQHLAACGILQPATPCGPLVRKGEDMCYSCSPGCDNCFAKLLECPSCGHIEMLARDACSRCGHPPHAGDARRGRGGMESGTPVLAAQERPEPGGRAYDRRREAAGPARERQLTAPRFASGSEQGWQRTRVAADARGVAGSAARAGRPASPPPLRRAPAAPGARRPFPSCWPARCPGKGWRRRRGARRTCRRAT